MRTLCSRVLIPSSLMIRGKGVDLVKYTLPATIYNRTATILKQRIRWILGRLILDSKLEDNKKLKRTLKEKTFLFTIWLQKITGPSFNRYIQASGLLKILNSNIKVRATRWVYSAVQSTKICVGLNTLPREDCDSALLISRMEERKPLKAMALLLTKHRIRRFIKILRNKSAGKAGTIFRTTHHWSRKLLVRRWKIKIEKAET